MTRQLPTLNDIPGCRGPRRSSVRSGRADEWILIDFCFVLILDADYVRDTGRRACVGFVCARLVIDKESAARVCVCVCVAGVRSRWFVFESHHRRRRRLKLQKDF